MTLLFIENKRTNIDSNSIAKLLIAIKATIHNAFDEFQNLIILFRFQYFYIQIDRLSLLKKPDLAVKDSKQFGELMDINFCL